MAIKSFTIRFDDSSTEFTEHVQLTDEQHDSVHTRLRKLKNDAVSSGFVILPFVPSSYESFDRLLKHYEGV
jgi:hypothetical protein